MLERTKKVSRKAEPLMDVVPEMFALSPDYRSVCAGYHRRRHVAPPPPPSEANLLKFSANTANVLLFGAVLREFPFSHRTDRDGKFGPDWLWNK